MTSLIVGGEEIACNDATLVAGVVLLFLPRRALAIVIVNHL